MTQTPQTPTPPRDVLVQVVAEMRKAAQAERDRSWEGAPHGADEWKLDDWADRIERALAGQGEDTKRLDFLESLMNRKRKFGWKEKEWSLGTDLHIASTGAAIYARSGVGSQCDFSAGGATVRETIDKAMDNARTQEPR